MGLRWERSHPPGAWGWNGFDGDKRGLTANVVRYGGPAYSHDENPGGECYWVGYLVREKVPGEHATAEEAMAAVDAAFEGR